MIVAISLLFVAPSLAALDLSQEAQFAAPVRLLAAGAPVNHVEEMPYPSPVVFDIDRDGKRELICGDLWGYLWVYENEGQEGDLHWSAPRKLTADGEVLKVPNW